MIRVRRAETYDILGIVPHLRAFATFAATKHSLYPGDAVAELKMYELIRDHVVFVATADDGLSGVDDVLIGFIAGLLTDHWMNEEIRILSELLWWVDPEYRGTRAGALLLKSFTEYGESNAHQMTMVLEQASPVKAESLEARGFHLHERTFLREMAA